MKIAKNAKIQRQIENERRNNLLFLICLIIVSLILGALPAISFGDPFATVRATENSGTIQPGFQGPAFESSSPSAAGAAPAFGLSTPQPISVPNDSTSASLLTQPTTNPMLGGPADIDRPHRNYVEPTTPFHGQPPQHYPASERTPERPAHRQPAQDIEIHTRVQDPVKPPTKPQTIAPQHAFGEPSYAELQQKPSMLRSISDPNHPFAYYFETPKPGQSTITGKPMPVAELLDNVSSPTVRKDLLRKYWELAGLMVQYNIRIDAELCVKRWIDQGRISTDRNILMPTYSLAQQERRAAELDFAKTQIQLAGLIKQSTGKTLEADDLPIPCDFPIYKKYATYLDQIAHTERSQYLGRLIPLQEQLIGTKTAGSKAANDILQGSIQNGQVGSRDLVFALNQRTVSFCELVDTVIEYNKLIADYTAETVGPGVSRYRLIGAIIELPNFTANLQNAAENPRLSQSPTPIDSIAVPSMSPPPTVTQAPSRTVATSEPSGIDLASYVPQANPTISSVQPAIPPRSNIAVPSTAPHQAPYADMKADQPAQFPPPRSRPETHPDRDEMSMPPRPSTAPDMEW